jgi:hypothetical protein
LMGRVVLPRFSGDRKGQIGSIGSSEEVPSGFRGDACEIESATNDAGSTRTRTMQRGSNSE